MRPPRALVAVVAFALAAPASARAATLALLDDPLRSPFAPALLAAGDADALRQAQGEGGEGAARGEQPPPKPDLQPRPPAPGELDFDLLGAAEAPKRGPDPEALKLRRTMLTWHQGLGFGLLGLQLGTTVVGQLSYHDKFGGAAPANTNRYRISHAALAYSSLGVFVVNGAVALLAPSPLRKLQMDRVMVHRVAMATAAAGMVAQGILGVRTAQHEGRLDQRRLAKDHLVIGYATLAAMAVGVGALAF